MAYVVMVIDCPNLPISELNNRLQNPGNLQDPINKCARLLQSIASGKVAGSVQVTSRDSDPAVSTSGSGSTQDLYDHR